MQHQDDDYDNMYHGPDDRPVAGDEMSTEGFLARFFGILLVSVLAFFVVSAWLSGKPIFGYG